MLGVVDNVQYQLKSRGYLMPFLSYYYFRYIGRHCYFRLSADIDSIRVGTALLSSLEAEIYVLPVLAAAILHFRLPVTSGSFFDSAVELLDPENVG